MSKPRRIFISATGQNAGKTTFSIGLIAALLKRFKNIGFIKPIGQRYLMEQGFKVDEDSVLIDKIFGLRSALSIKDLSPIAVERGFTEKYIESSSNKNDYAKDILNSFKRVGEGKDLVIIEGTGHAGVGSVFDLSNATVAKLLRSKVILLAPGGVGRPIDEVMLNKALFDKEGVKLAGVVVNKVLPSKFGRIKGYIKMGFKKKALPVLGVMPYQKRLDLPTMREIYEEVKIKLLCGEKYLENTVDKILIGAMEVKDALKYIVDNSLIITPSDRMDMISAMIDVQRGKIKKNCKIAGLVLSGGMEPPARIIALLEEHRIPTLLSEGDTYSIAAKIHSIKVKIKPEDKNKIDIIIKMVNRYVDMDRIVENIGG
ncbi:MAG: AAA family ATPase [Candidatus Omnitrophota bacterium]|nr:MAG: AAA family ATPase [Candidatus Omnitrophota bacterium]